MFRGSITALITPFKNGEIDWNTFDNLIEHQIESGTHGLVACGTTAESPTLTHDEHQHILQRCVSAVKGRIPVIAGTGSNNTQTSVEMTAYARQIGADAALVVTPYYNKPTQEGLYAHYHTIAGAVNLPLIIYNIPGRCVIDMTPETMGRLARIPHIVGVKDATGDLTRVKKQTATCGGDFIQLSGEDGMIYDFLEQGGVGCISVTSNIAPALCAQMHNSWIAGDKAKAKQYHAQLMPLHNALFCESSPQPAKYAASRLGLCLNELRLPLLRASEEACKIVDDALARTGLVVQNSNAGQAVHG
ncbi:MAG: 4-hydroxy-tetrahydrodipicolinate synthase [Alphaproteobacteria bacterium CG_4_9_14_3_um_filter_47_13]|nr:MAG: 4-hydroxy-tetrahydrodipicolinate synthase [Alphaproteobacteria bacterium CG_4_9_14_3_um_filter_47_13]